MLDERHFEWLVMISLLAAVALYSIGARRSRRQTGPAAIRIVAFYAGLLVVLVALESPIDRLADRYFWVPMLQHELLLMVAPPLVLLGKPLPVMWRAISLPKRRQVARSLVRSARWQGRVASSRRLANSSGSLDHVHGQLLSLARALRL